LVKSYDVLFEQFRPGVLERLGVGHRVLLEENPRLVVCALTGYGQDGPLRDKAGHDINYMARAGLLGLQGPAEGVPAIPAFQLADVSGGLWSVVAILAALRERDRTGQGSVLDVAMIESVVPFSTIAFGKLFAGELPERGGEILTGGVAPYLTYATQDGQYVTLGALEPKFLMKFCQATGIDADLSALLPGPHQVELKRRFAEVFASRTRKEWEAFSDQYDCCVEPVLRPDELFDDPHLAARRVFVDFDTGDGKLTEYRTPVTPRDLEPGPAPRQGEHTDAIFGDAGFSPDEVAALRASGAIR
jgi:crotonobetainyl-CoA:carnitine CoA-transferase CaiB-like acyl-CoA transferase